MRKAAATFERPNTNSNSPANNTTTCPSKPKLPKTTASALAQNPNLKNNAFYQAKNSPASAVHLPASATKPGLSRQKCKSNPKPSSATSSPTSQACPDSSPDLSSSPLLEAPPNQQHANTSCRILHKPQMPILSLSPHTMGSIDPSDADSMCSLWSVFSKCADSLENGRRLENISWRLWNRELLFDSDAAAAHKDHPSCQKPVPIPVAPLPPDAVPNLSSSIDSDSSGSWTEYSSPGNNGTGSPADSLSNNEESRPSPSSTDRGDTTAITPQSSNISHASQLSSRQHNRPASKSSSEVNISKRRIHTPSTSSSTVALPSVATTCAASLNLSPVRRRLHPPKQLSSEKLKELLLLFKPGSQEEEYWKSLYEARKKQREQQPKATGQEKADLDKSQPNNSNATHEPSQLQRLQSQQQLPRQQPEQPEQPQQLTPPPQQQQQQQPPSPSLFSPQRRHYSIATLPPQHPQPSHPHTPSTPSTNPPPSHQSLFRSQTSIQLKPQNRSLFSQNTGLSNPINTALYSSRQQNASTSRLNFNSIPAHPDSPITTINENKVISPPQYSHNIQQAQPQRTLSLVQPQRTQALAQPQTQVPHQNPAREQNNRPNTSLFRNTASSSQLTNDAYKRSASKDRYRRVQSSLFAKPSNTQATLSQVNVASAANSEPTEANKLPRTASSLFPLSKEPASRRVSLFSKQPSMKSLFDNTTAPAKLRAPQKPDNEARSDDYEEEEDTDLDSDNISDTDDDEASNQTSNSGATDGSNSKEDATSKPQDDEPEFIGIDSNGSRLTYRHRSDTSTSIVRGFNPSTVSIARTRSTMSVNSPQNPPSPNVTFNKVFSGVNTAAAAPAPATSSGSAAGSSQFVLTKARPDKVPREKMFFIESSPSESENGTNSPISQYGFDNSDAANKPKDSNSALSAQQSPKEPHHPSLFGTTSVSKVPVPTTTSIPSVKPKAKFTLAGQSHDGDDEDEDNDDDAESDVEDNADDDVIADASIKDADHDDDDEEEEDDNDDEDGDDDDDEEDDDDDDFDDDSSWDSVDDESDEDEPFDESAFVRDVNIKPRPLTRPSLLSSMLFNNPEKAKQDQLNREAIRKAHSNAAPQSNTSAVTARKPAELASSSGQGSSGVASPSLLHAQLKSTVVTNDSASPSSVASRGASTTATAVPATTTYTTVHSTNSPFNHGADDASAMLNSSRVSPRATRRSILATELSESVRKHLLWERNHPSALNPLNRPHGSTTNFQQQQQQPQQPPPQQQNSHQNSSFSANQPANTTQLSGPAVARLQLSRRHTSSEVQTLGQLTKEKHRTSTNIPSFNLPKNQDLNNVRIYERRAPLFFDLGEEGDGAWPAASASPGASSPSSPKTDNGNGTAHPGHHDEDDKDSWRRDLDSKADFNYHARGW